MSLTIATLNIASASSARAKAIMEWLPSVHADVWVLTETSVGPGTSELLTWFHRRGWSCTASRVSTHERGVAICSRSPTSILTLRPPDDPLPGRALSLRIPTNLEPITLLGMYLPTRGNDVSKLERKSSYMASWLRFLTRIDLSRVIVLGDLNIVPAGQSPRAFPQFPFEYAWLEALENAGLHGLTPGLEGRHESTWSSPGGEGYTFDHILVGELLMSRLESFAYRHESRVFGISDHSAVLARFDFETMFSAPDLGSPMPAPEQEGLF